MMSLRFCVEFECVKSSHSASKEAGKRERKERNCRNYGDAASTAQS